MVISPLKFPKRRFSNILDSLNKYNGKIHTYAGGELEQRKALALTRSLTSVRALGRARTYLILDKPFPRVYTNTNTRR